VAIIGAIGYAMSVLRFEAAPLLLGFILGPMMEEYLRRALLLSRGDPMVFVERPISATLLACGAGLLVWSIWGAVKRTARERAEEDAGTSAATQST
jgi:TctA family transporter